MNVTVATQRLCFPAATLVIDIRKCLMVCKCQSIGGGVLMSDSISDQKYVEDEWDEGGDSNEDAPKI